MNQDNILIYRKPSNWYAARLSDRALLKNSQSGGALYSIEKEIIDAGGVVYGCVYDGKKVIHSRIDNASNLTLLQGSKYVQSDLGTCFIDVRNDLKEGKIVLFTGTPCQCAGVQTYINGSGVNDEKLITCEFICHGVPSPMVYNDYLLFMEEQKAQTITEINLRDKKVAGWRNHVESLVFADGQKYTGKIYVDLFYSNFALRRSCEKCMFTRMERISDITVADCWGIEKTRPSLWNDNEGISMVLVQTDKGKTLFESVVKAGTVDIVELQSEELIQPQMKHSSRVPHQKEQFWKDYHHYSFEQILKKYTEYGGIPFKIKRKIMKALNKW